MPEGSVEQIKEHTLTHKDTKSVCQTDRDLLFKQTVKGPVVSDIQ